MSPTIVIAKRELQSYFATPIAYVFMVIFLLFSGILTFYIGGFYEREQADLSVFFGFHPWLYLVLVPAISMRLWAEERKAGSIELLMTLPVTLWQAVLGKFIAAWLFVSVALALTFPMWLTVNYLGNPDNGAIVTGYLASVLLAGALLAVGSCISAVNRNQVIAFVLTMMIGFIMLLTGFPLVLDFFTGWLPDVAVNAVANLSLLTHYSSLSRGVVELSDVVFFILTIVTWLFATTIILDLKKAD